MVFFFPAGILERNRDLNLKQAPASKGMLVEKLSGEKQGDADRGSFDPEERRKKEKRFPKSEEFPKLPKKAKRLGRP